MLEWLVLVLGGMAVGVRLANLQRQDPRHSTDADRIRTELTQELERSRRYGRSFQLARLTLDSAAATPTIEARRTDRVWSLMRETYVLLPETDRLAADAWARRVRAQLPNAEIRLAGFPEDGLTLAGLLDRLDPEPDRVPENPVHSDLDGRGRVAS